MSMTLIQTVTVGSGGQAQIDFNSIPATFTDLVLVLSGRSSRNDFQAAGINISFNGNTSDYSYRDLFGTGGTRESTTGTRGIGLVPSVLTTSNTFSNSQTYIPNYRSNVAKSYSTELVYSTNTSGTYYDWETIMASLWNNTSAITSISLSLAGGSNFVQHSSASLYGILAGSSGGVVVS